MGPFNGADLGLMFDWMSFYCTESRENMLCWECPKYEDPLNRADDLGIPEKKSASEGRRRRTHTQVLGRVKASAPLFVPETSSPHLRLCVWELNHLSSSPPNTDIGFIVRHWPLPIGGDVLKCKCPGPDRRFWFALRNSVNQHVTLFEWLCSFIKQVQYILSSIFQTLL